MSKAQESVKQLGNALERLREALAEKESDNALAIDATIQRFEFVIELYWKTFTHLLEEEKIMTASPKQALQRAYQKGWIEEDKPWLDMLDDRNQTSHTYKEPLAREIYGHIRGYFPVMAETYKRLLTILQRNA